MIPPKQIRKEALILSTTFNTTFEKAIAMVLKYHKMETITFTYEELAIIFNCTKQRIQQIEVKAIGRREKKKESHILIKRGRLQNPQYHNTAYYYCKDANNTIDYKQEEICKL